MLYKSGSFYTAIMMAVFYLLFCNSTKAQTPTNTISINQAPVVTGSFGSVNSTYRRANVLPGVDAVFKIVSLLNGASLAMEDDAVGATGIYLDAWQPAVNTGAATGSGGIIWRIDFYVNGTNTPYLLNSLSLLAIDVDGNGTGIQDYVEAVNPYNFTALASGASVTHTGTTLGVRTQSSTINPISGIDSTQKQGMVQYRFVNVTNIILTTGYIKSSGNATIQNSLFFNTQTNFPGGFTKYYNTDKDAIKGINETTDLDDDNDGIKDTDEYSVGLSDPMGDSDGDNIPNYMDAIPGAIGCTFIDSNADGINDNYDNDRDGIINSLDIDSDNDGIPDIIEAGGIDTDGNGRVDNFSDGNGNGLDDVYDASAGGANIVNLNTDSDGIPNFLDLDSDNDGIPDVVEANAMDANNDGRIDDFLDRDSDGLADAVDGDVGNDGFSENVDAALIITSGVSGAGNRPLHYIKGNADKNGLPNAYDLDADGDGILDAREAGIAQDTNNDGILNSLDGLFTDNNSDGWSDQVANQATLIMPNSDTDKKPNYLDIDSDNDGIGDNIEAQATVNYILPSGLDDDEDGIDNSYDNQIGTFAGTNGNGLSPYNFDATDLPDYLDTDSDNDGVKDNIEGNDWNGNGLADENTVISGLDTDDDGLDDIFDIVDGPDVTIVGFAGTGSRTTAQKTVASAPDRDWRNQSLLLNLRLLSLSAGVENDIANIRWSVQNESNTNKYIIERSVNGVEFSSRGYLSALNTQSQHNYLFKDPINDIAVKTIFYRLKIEDHNGTFKYSTIVKLTLQSGNNNEMVIIGNPVSERSQIKITTVRSTTAMVNIYGTNGQKYYSGTVKLNNGVNNISFMNLSNFAKGNYVLNVTIDGVLFTKTFVY